LDPQIAWKPGVEVNAKAFRGYGARRYTARAPLGGAGAETRADILKRSVSCVDKQKYGEAVLQ